MERLRLESEKDCFRRAQYVRTGSERLGISKTDCTGCRIWMLLIKLSLRSAFGERGYIVEGTIG